MFYKTPSIEYLNQVFDYKNLEKLTEQFIVINPNCSIWILNYCSGCGLVAPYFFHVFKELFLITL